MLATRTMASHQRRTSGGRPAESRSKRPGSCRRRMASSSASSLLLAMGGGGSSHHFLGAAASASAAFHPPPPPQRMWDAPGCSSSSSTTNTRIIQGPVDPVRCNFQHRIIRPRDQYRIRLPSSSSPHRSRLGAAEEDPSEEFDEGGEPPGNDRSGSSGIPRREDGEFGGDDDQECNDDDQGSASSSVSHSEEEGTTTPHNNSNSLGDLGDCVSKGGWCSMEYLDAIAKVSAEQQEQEREVLASSSAAASSSEVLVGDLPFPIIDADDGATAAQRIGGDDDDVSSSTTTSKAITAERQAQSIQNIRDGAMMKKRRSKSKKRDNRTRTALSKSIPSYRSLLTFVATTVLIWLSEPLLSLIDTTAVGRFGGVGGASAATSATTLPNLVKTKLLGFLAYVGLCNEVRPDLPALSPSVLNLASLGPATLLVDNCLYLCYFLSIATTNQLAKQLAQNDAEGMVRTTSHVLGVAVCMGLLLTGFVWGCGESVLSGIVGDSATTATAVAGTAAAARSGGAAAGSAAVQTGVVRAAWEYARIRSSIGILAVLDIVAQSVLLATLDLKTPVLAVLFTSLTNILGDWLLVVRLGMGIRGAAIATAAANVVSCSLLLSAVFRKFHQWKRQAAKEREENMWREGRVSIAGLKGGEHTTAAATSDDDPILPDGLGVVGSKAKRMRITRDDDNATETPTSKGYRIRKIRNLLQVPSIGLSSKEQFVIALDNIQKGLVRTTTMASELAAAFSLSVAVKALGKQARIQLSTSGHLAKSAKAAMQKIVGRKDDLPPFISLPRKDDFVSLLKFAGPIFFIILLKVMCYSQMTLRASDMGMLSLASHNVLLRIFFFYTTFGDALSQAAQTFLPEVMYGVADKTNTGEGVEISSDISKAKRREERRKRVKATLGRMLALSGTLAVLNCCISTWILSNCGGWFTSDSDIIGMIGKNCRFLSFSVLLHSFVMLFEGGIMASGPSGLMYLLKSYMATFVLLTGALKYGATDLGGVWKVWFGFQVVRLFQFGARVWKKTVIGSDNMEVDSSKVEPAVVDNK